MASIKEKQQDTLKKVIENRTDIGAQSKRTYIRALNNIFLNVMSNLSNATFLNFKKKLLKAYDDKQNFEQIVQIMCVMTYMIKNNHISMKETEAKKFRGYYDELLIKKREAINDKYFKEGSRNDKNYITYEEQKGVFEKLKVQNDRMLKNRKIDKISYEMNQKVLMLAFYTLLKPKRNVYYDVLIINSLKEVNLNDDEDKRNYLIIMNCNKGCKIRPQKCDNDECDLIKIDLNKQKLTNDPQILFLENSYKTVKTYGKKLYIINNEELLNMILQSYWSFPREVLFQTWQQFQKRSGQGYSKSNFTRFQQRVLEQQTGIRASVNIFRHARVNHEFDSGKMTSGQKILDMSEQFDHSVNMLLKYNQKPSEEQNKNTNKKTPPQSQTQTITLNGKTYQLVEQ